MRRILVLGVALQLFIPLTRALSLNQNFQPLQISVPAACAAAYNKQIPNCSASDFADGSTCSAACITGLNQIASQINTACAGAEAESSSLLGVVFLGQLTAALCPETELKPSSTPEKQSVTRAPATSTTATSISTPAVAKTSTSSSRIITTASPTTTSPSSPPSISPSTLATDTGATSSATNMPAGGSQTQGQNTSMTPNPSPISKLSVAEQQILAIANGGGGSPFEIVGYSGSSRVAGDSSQIKWVLVLALSVGVLLGSRH